MEAKTKNGIFKKIKELKTQMCEHATFSHKAFVQDFYKGFIKLSESFSEAFLCF